MKNEDISYSRRLVKRFWMTKSLGGVRHKAPKVGLDPQRLQTPERRPNSTCVFPRATCTDKCSAICMSRALRFSLASSVVLSMAKVRPCEGGQRHLIGLSVDLQTQALLVTLILRSSCCEYLTTAITSSSFRADSSKKASVARWSQFI